MFYYEIHVFFSRHNGYSIAVKSETELTDDEAINLALKEEKFSEAGDHHNVDYVDTLTEEEYKIFSSK